MTACRDRAGTITDMKLSTFATYVAVVFLGAFLAIEIAARVWN